MATRMEQIGLAAMAGLAAFVVACTKHPSDFCCTTAESCAYFGSQPVTPCTDPDRPYCDDTGAYGTANVCIPDPTQTSCKVAQDCKNPDLPYCVGGVCVECDGDSTCSGAKAVCEPMAHVCVECIDSSTCTSATAPVCDATQHACRGCTADAECASNVCDRETGSCVAEASVIYLSPTGQTSGTCTRAAPCKTFALGLAQVSSTRDIIKAAPGTYSGKATIDGVTVTIFGDGATIQPTATDQSVIAVTNVANATIVGMAVNGSTGPVSGIGIRCDAGSRLRVHRSTVKANGGGGILVSGCEYSLLNNIIIGNGGASSALGGVKIDSITSSGLHEFSFNTVAGNTGVAGANTGVDCSSVFVPLSFSSSIVYGNTVGGTGAQVGGAMCSWSYSDIGPQAVTGTGNINADPQFVNAGAGDFHIQASSPARNVADPAASLGVDIDLDMRPCGAARDMGADEVCP